MLNLTNSYILVFLIIGVLASTGLFVLLFLLKEDKYQLEHTKDKSDLKEGKDISIWN